MQNNLEINKTHRTFAKSNINNLLIIYKMSKAKHIPKRRFSVETLLLSMNKGDVEYIPLKKCSTATVRVYATKLKNTGLFEFKPSTKGLIDSTQVIRIK